MRWTPVVLLALCGLAFAQEPATAPTLTAEEAVMVQAVMGLQQSAQAACEALPEVKRYTDTLRKATAALQASGKQVDWRTGKPVAKEQP